MGTFFRRAFSNLTFSEVSGSLGDLGTFLPLLVGLVQVVGLDLGTTLVATGIYNVITGFQFGIPMPVQPMKTISAVALGEESLTVPEIVVAGLSVSAVVLFLGATGLMKTFNKIVPLSLVRGIQLGVGVKLAIKGVRMAIYEDSKGRDWRDWGGADGLVLGVLAIVFILITTMPTDSSVRLESDACASNSTTPCDEGNEESREGPLNASSDLDKDLEKDRYGDKELLRKTKSFDTVSCGPTSRNWISRLLTADYKPPTALIVIVLGIILTIIYHPSVISTLKLGPSSLEFVIPTLKEVKNGILRAGLPQLPLTTLNSVVAVCNLSQELFPDNPASPNAVAFSVGMMNIVGSWFGVMPCCHGAGGLAAQTKFGAKTGTAPIFLGVVKIILGLLFGSSLFDLLQRFPKPLLGALLMFSGIELAGCCRSERGARGVGLMLITASASFATNNTAIGFGFGATSVILLQLYDILCSTIHKHKALPHVNTHTSTSGPQERNSLESV